jgi:hypothetical protein
VLALTIALVVIIAAAAIGFFTAWVEARWRRFHKSTASALAIWVVSPLMGLFAFGILSVAETIWPTEGSPIFGEAEDVVLSTEIEFPPAPCTGLCAGGLGRLRNTVSLHYPLRVAIQNDFEIALTFEDEYRLDQDVRWAILHAPKYIEARTTQRCKGSSAEEVGAVKACVRAERPDAHSLQFRWDATPTHTGTARMAITSELFGAKSSSSNSIQIVSDNNVHQAFGRKDDLHDIASGQTTASAGDVTINLSSGELHFPVEVITTLGVSQEMYDWIKVIAAVITVFGTLLGAGFGLKLFTRKRDQDIYDALFRE